MALGSSSVAVSTTGQLYSSIPVVVASFPFLVQVVNFCFLPTTLGAGTVPVLRSSVAEPEPPGAAT